MEKIKYQGKYIRVTEEVIDNAVWERAYIKDGVQVFPITSEGKIILIEEKRPHESQATRLKFVTGQLDAGEDPIEAANREMQEEIGFKADHLEIILTSKNSGTINSSFYQILAKGLTPSKIPNPDGEDTIVSIKEFTVNELDKLIEEEKLNWNLGLLGYFKLKQKGLL